jgi:hypothetical protein
LPVRRNMEITKKKYLINTEEVTYRKISLRRHKENQLDERGGVLGWEAAPPQVGERYAVYLGEGNVLKTSPVEEVERRDNVLMVRTMNSIYRVEYLE